MATELDIREKGPRTRSYGYSMPPEVGEEVERRAQRLNVPKSALVSAILSNYFDANPLPAKRKGGRS